MILHTIQMLENIQVVVWLTLQNVWVIGLGLVILNLNIILKTCIKNANCISKTSENELIYCCGKFIKDALIKDIKESFFFSILGFFHCELGLSGKALAETILA